MCEAALSRSGPDGQVEDHDGGDTHRRSLLQQETFPTTRLSYSASRRGQHCITGERRRPSGVREGNDDQARELHSGRVITSASREEERLGL